MLPATTVQILLVVSGFVTAVACILALLSRRDQISERRRLRRKMLGINDQYRLMRQELREAEDGRGRLQRDLSRSEDSRRELDLLCQNLEEEIRRLRETRPAPMQQELDWAPPVAAAPEHAGPEAITESLPEARTDAGAPFPESIPELAVEEADAVAAPALPAVPGGNAERAAFESTAPPAAASALEPIEAPVSATRGVVDDDPVADAEPVHAAPGALLSAIAAVDAPAPHPEPVDATPSAASSATELVNAPVAAAEPVDAPAVAADPIASGPPQNPAKTAGPRRGARGRITPKRAQGADSDGDQAETA